jgi:hypothetical protein
LTHAEEVENTGVELKNTPTYDFGSTGPLGYRRQREHHLLPGYARDAGHVRLDILVCR